MGTDIFGVEGDGSAILSNGLIDLMDEAKGDGEVAMGSLGNRTNGDG